MNKVLSLQKLPKEEDLGKREILIHPKPTIVLSGISIGCWADF